MANFRVCLCKAQQVQSTESSFGKRSWELVTALSLFNIPNTIYTAHAAHRNLYAVAFFLPLCICMCTYNHTGPPALEKQQGFCVAESRGKEG